MEKEQTVDRKIPFSREAEMHVLGGILVEPPQLGGQVFCLEGLVSGHHQQIELRALPVAEEQVLAYFPAQDGLDQQAVLHGVGMVVVHPVKGDGQGVQGVGNGVLLGRALLRRPAGIAYRIDVHGASS